MKKIILSLPPSVNQQFGGGGGRFYKSEKAKDWFDAAGFDVLVQWGERNGELKGKVRLFIYWFFKRERDIDSGLKPLLDVLTGIVYQDDKQVTEVNMRKYSDKEDPRVEIVIE